MKPDGNEDAYWEALARHAAGEGTGADAQVAEAGLATDPGQASLLEGLERLSAAAPHVDVEAALRRVHTRLDGADVVSLEERRRAPRVTIPWRAAAAIALVAGGAALWQYSDRSAPKVPAIAAQTFETRVGETDTLHLSDATRIVLGPSSRLVVAAGYGERERSVELEGVALFDVVHDATREFRVRAGSSEIRDLGTSFTVRTDDAGGVHVVVTEGSVMVNERIALDAGDAASVDARGVAQESAASAEALAWTSGRLVFEDADFLTVADDLRRWYGVRLVAGDNSIAQQRLTSTFEGESVQDVLNIISLALGARIEQRGDTTVLHTMR